MGINKKNVCEGFFISTEFLQKIFIQHLHIREKAIDSSLYCDFLHFGILLVQKKPKRLTSLS